MGGPQRARSDRPAVPHAGRGDARRDGAQPSARADASGSRPGERARRRAPARADPQPPIPMPDFWGGYVLMPETVEFWQAGTFRLHDRLRYRRHDDGWTIERLSP